MGPDTYDLVSLLRDSYIDISEDALEDYLAYFLALTRRTPSAGPDAGEFRRRFDLMALQRNLKALGTFGYMTATRRNPVYIQYMPRTLRYARTNLLEVPALRAACASCSRQLRRRTALTAAPAASASLAGALRAKADSRAASPDPLQWMLHPEEDRRPCSSACRPSSYHAQRLPREHLAEVAAHGFDAVEIVATRSHVDYHDPAASMRWPAG